MSDHVQLSNKPSIELFPPRSLGPREWGVELLIAETPQYLGKVLFMDAGKAGGLQYHREKIETFYLFSGSAWVDYDQDGALVRLAMSPGMSVHVPARAPHRVTAITDSIFFECSTPIFNDRVRCEAEYGEPEIGGLPTMLKDYPVAVRHRLCGGIALYAKRPLVSGEALPRPSTFAHTDGRICIERASYLSVIRVVR